MTGRLEKWTLGVAILGMLGTGGYLLMPEKTLKRAEFAENTSIGSVKPVGLDVRLRGPDDLSWGSVKRDTMVFHRDKIFTGSSSSAVVSLKSQQQLTIEPNSLVMIGDQDKTVFIDLNASGGFLGEIKKGVKFFVKRDNSNLELEGDGSVISVFSRKKEELKMVVLRGEAQVKMKPDAVPIKIAKNTELTISSNKTESKILQIQLQSPQPTSIIWAGNESVHFSWSVVSDLAPVEEFVVEISQDPLFEELVSDIRTQDTSAQARILNTGVYFWRVRVPTSGQETLSATASFSVYQLRPPEIHKDITLDVETDWRGRMKNSVILGWNDPSFSEHYEVEVSKDEKFGGVLYKERTQEQKMQIAHLNEGQFYWRVISYHSSRAPLTSEVGRIQIRRAEPATSTLAESTPEPTPEPTPAPMLVKELRPPELNKLWKFTLKKKEAPVEVFWTPVEGADRYEIVISSHSDFRTIIYSEEVLGTKWRWQQPKIGQFYFVVKALKGPEAASSQVSSLIVKDNPLALKLALEEPGAEAAPVIHAEWRAVAEAVIDSSSEEATLEEATLEREVVEESRVNSEELRLETKDTVEKPKLTVYLGTGGSYLLQKQQGSDDTESGQYANFVGPTTLVGAQLNFTEKHALELQYNRWPGEFKSNSAPLRASQFNWQSYLAEYKYQFARGSNLQYSLLLGLQNHQVPFLSTGQDGFVDILKNEFLNASVGLKASYLGSTGFEYEAFIRYQTPLSSRSLDGYAFKASPKMMFDGSLGVSRKFTERLRAGVYWFGQYQDYQYEFTRDGNFVQGDQTLLNSNIQIRLGWEFFGILSLAGVPVIRRLRRPRKKTERVRRMKRVTAFWVLLFLAGTFMVGIADEVHKSHYAGIAEARLIQKMGQGWLVEAQMAERIGIRQVIVKKMLENKISSFRVTLASREKFNPIYREQLLQYLNHRGRFETGFPYEFSF